MDAKKLIQSAGGSTEVAKKLGYPKKGGVQRVNNWKSRGIPARVMLEHPEIFTSRKSPKKAA